MTRRPPGPRILREAAESERYRARYMGSFAPRHRALSLELDADADRLALLHRAPAARPLFPVELDSTGRPWFRLPGGGRWDPDPDTTPEELALRLAATLVAVLDATTTRLAICSGCGRPGVCERCEGHQ